MVQANEEQIALQQAVDNLYTVFARYPLRPDTEACPCCHDPEDEPRLHAKPLKDLSDEDLGKFAWSSLLTWGEVEDFKHFLPRLFEIVCERTSFEWPNTPVLFAKLHYADWRTWPEDEQAAVQDYLTALWRYCLTRWEEDADIDDILCGIAQAVDDLSPYLEMWLKADLVGYHLLAGYVIQESATIAEKGRLSNPSWRDRRDSASPFGHDRMAQMNQVIDWLAEPATKEALEQAFFEYSSDPMAQNLATAADWLDWLDWLAKFRAAKSGA